MPAGHGPDGWGGGVVPPELGGLPADDFQSAINKFAEKVWKETQREEASLIDVGATPGFSRDMVSRAVKNATLGAGAAKPQSWQDITSFVVSLLASVLVGVASNYLEETWGVAVFPAAIVVMLVAAVVNYRGGRN